MGYYVNYHYGKVSELCQDDEDCIDNRIFVRSGTLHHPTKDGLRTWVLKLLREDLEHRSQVYVRAQKDLEDCKDSIRDVLDW